MSPPADADSFPRSSGSSAFSYASDELDAMASAVNYYRWIAERFAPYLGDRILEVGAGIGTFGEHLRRVAPEASLTLLEPASNNTPRLRERFAGVPQVQVIEGVLDERAASGSASSVVAVNVLEHVRDDAAFVRDAARVLVPGGYLLLFVPALPGIYGTLDEAFEHHRRYTSSGLDRLLSGAGFAVESLRYTNLPGVLAWWVTGRVLRRRTVAARAAAAYDRLVVPWVRWLERFWSPPAGQSLIAVARRA